MLASVWRRASAVADVVAAKSAPRESTSTATGSSSVISRVVLEMYPNYEANLFSNRFANSCFFECVLHNHCNLQVLSAEKMITRYLLEKFLVDKNAVPERARFSLHR